jgi:nicotinate-nucleotide pyrophosphorylase (carboxylating)
VRAIVRRALDEDVGDGDVTTNCIVSPEGALDGRFIAREAGVIAGLTVAALAFTLLDDRIRFTPTVAEGDSVTRGASLATVAGPARALLTGERTALNLLQRMSGIATLTRRFVEAVRPWTATILDTRKTAPGLRLLDKWAVRVGGARNHRAGLYDMVLIKGNHVVAAGGITQAVARVRERDAQHRAIEVEVSTLAELRETLALSVDRVMLDNMSLDEMREAVRMAAGRVPLEASGRITLENVAEVAAAGVDYISIGALTHSARALDISLTIASPAVSPSPTSDASR